MARHLRRHARRGIALVTALADAGLEPGDRSRFSSRTGARPWSRSTGSRWADSSSCRSCTSTAPRKCASSWPRAGPAVHLRRPVRPRRLPRHRRRRAGRHVRTTYEYTSSSVADRVRRASAVPGVTRVVGQASARRARRAGPRRAIPTTCACSRTRRAPPATRRA